MTIKSKGLRKCVVFGIIFCVITAGALIASEIGTDASSIPSATGRINASGGAYVRQSPSSKSSVVRVTSNGAAVSISYEKYASASDNSSSNIWYYTSLGGFVRADLVSVSYGSVSGQTTDQLNARSGAGTGFGIQRTFSKGTSVSVVLNAYDSNGNLWYKVSTGNGYSYVLAKFVSLSPTTGNTGTSAGSNSNVSTNTAVAAFSATGTANGPLNARSGAGTNYRVIATYSSNTALTIIGKITVSGTVWYKLSNGSYVCGTYVKLNTNSGNTGSSDNSSNVSSYSATGTTTDVLSVRSGPGTDYGVKTTYAKGQKLTIIGKVNVGNVAWYKLSNGYFVCGTYVSISEAGNSGSNSNTPSVTDYSATGIANGPLNARTGPGTNYKAINTYSSGSKITITGKITVNGVIWYRITGGNYVCGTYVKMNDSSAQKPEYTVTDYSVAGTTTTVLNARTGPGTKYPVKATYNRGTALTIVGTVSISGETWYKLSNGYFVSATYVGLGNSGGTGGSGNSGGSGSNSGTASMTDAQFAKYLSDQGFPSSYVSKLVALHQAYPSWDFKVEMTGLDWDTAMNKMYSSNSNLIYSTYKPGYRDVSKDSFNFLTKQYIPKDGSSFFKASQAGVAYFMDPRNWLEPSSIMMFEDHKYSAGYQTEDIVKSVLTYNSTLRNASSNFMSAASTYNINPVYLASKSYSELGTSDFMINGHSFTYDGRTYSNCYNAYNIGANDSATGSAAIAGLVYANGGVYGNNTSYGRKWNSLGKAILGGAQFISNDYISKNQHTGYLEHFNVMNGLPNVGSHVYMTAVYGPMSIANVQYNNYKKYGILNNTMVFKIPVYNNMPENPMPKASDGSNNCYLDSLSFKAAGNTSNLIICDAANINTVHQTTFTATVANDVTSVNLNAAASDAGASISGIGELPLNVGVNTFTVTCQAPSGITRTYTVKITRAG